MTQLKVLIGGGSGFIGQALSNLLLKNGYAVTNISRRAAADTITWNDIQRNGIPDNTHAVVNLAGQNIMDLSKKWTSDFESELRSSRLHTTAQLVRTITESETPPKSFVCASAIGYYPTSDTATYDESYVGSRSDFLQTLCMDWEEAAKLPSSCSTRPVQVRIGVALGRDGGMIANMIPAFFMGVGGRLGSGTQWLPWIHVKDVAGIILHAIETESIRGPINAVAPEAINNAQFTQTFAKALWRPAIIPVPEFAIRAAIHPERANMLLQGQKVVPTVALQSGYKFIYPDIKSAAKEFAHIMINMND